MKSASSRISGSESRGNGRLPSHLGSGIEEEGDWIRFVRGLEDELSELTRIDVGRLREIVSLQSSYSHCCGYRQHLRHFAEDDTHCRPFTCLQRTGKLLSKSVHQETFVAIHVVPMQGG